jgi:hypothetical protein
MHKFGGGISLHMAPGTVALRWLELREVDSDGGRLMDLICDHMTPGALVLVLLNLPLVLSVC